MKTQETLCINKNGNLSIGGCDTQDLVKQFGTPLYVMDYAHIKNMANAMVEAAKLYYPDSLVCYASKALACLGMYQITASLGLGADVASGGELFTALQAGTNPQGIYFHGNNKTVSELTDALNADIHAVVIDSFDEITRLDALATQHKKVQGVMIRVNPGVEAHTHEYIQTAKVDSKFGLSIQDGSALKAVAKVLEAKNLKLLGLHCHIGSQIFETEPFELAVDKMTDFIAVIAKTLNVHIQELNMGGGFGIRYTEEDKPLEPKAYVQAIAQKLKQAVKEKGLKAPRLILEPGRSIVGEAGITLYEIGTIKKIPDVRTYVAVNGGMYDNPRHALYQAKYAATLALKAAEPKTEKVTIAGKCCESGDILTKDVSIQKPSVGDILAVYSTGAYNYSMASNYNRNLIPPVVLAKEGSAEYLIKPQSYQDLIARDVIIKA